MSNSPKNKQKKVDTCNCGHPLEQHSKTVNWCCEKYDCPCKKYSEMNSPKDYLTDRVAEYEKIIEPIYLEVEASVANDLHVKLRAFLTETIQQSMEVGREQREKEIIEKMPHKVDSHLHQAFSEPEQKWLKTDREQRAFGEGMNYVLNKLSPKL